MDRGRSFVVVLAVAASCVSSTVCGQNGASNASPATLSSSASLAGVPATEPTAAPAVSSIASSTGALTLASTATSTISTAKGLTEETPWFQRFTLPVPEATATVDGWLSCTRPGVMANVDYLNWSARRSGLDFAGFVNPASGVASPTENVSLDFDRSSGCRAGIGYRFGNGWNLAWTYTYFCDANSETVTANTMAAGNPNLIATQSYLDTGLAVKTPMSSVEADGTLQINIQDFEAQWSSCLNDTVGFTAFGGFRWARIDQNFNTTYTYAAGKGTINLPNNMDAEGIRLGAELEWRSCCGLRVFGRSAESVLVADFQTGQREVAPASGVNINVSTNTSAVVPVFEGAVGVAYARGRWEFRAGYEMGDWFNLVQLNRPAQSLLLDGYFLSLSFSQ